MLVSFRQTYGSGREELYEIYFRDRRLQELHNLCDLNVFSFHNCEQRTIDRFKEKNPIQNVEYLEFEGISYPDTVRQTKEYLKDIGATHFFFTQDDTFIALQHNHVDWKELVDYVRRHDREFMLNLYHRVDILYIEDEFFEGEVEELNTFNVYKSTTLDFYNSDKTPWPMDDTAYFCTMDILDEIYDEEYFSYGDIWNAEKFLRRKFGEKEINRFVTDKKILQNYNLYGKTTYLSGLFRKILIQNVLYE